MEATTGRFGQAATLAEGRGPGFRKLKNPVLGLDVAGTVVAVGADVTRFASCGSP